VPLQAAIQRGGGELLNRRVGAEPTGADVVRDIVRVGYRVIADLQVSDDGRLLTVTVVVGNVRPHKRPDPQPF
ncbi:MAG TPA: hypothetical protein VNW68_04270, partial [Candidatus Limnocylindria bacterium]|nr:hypothetical protein [Candidatus Limnocylindria bacterium]